MLLPDISCSPQVTDHILDQDKVYSSSNEAHSLPPFKITKSSAETGLKAKMIGYFYSLQVGNNDETGKAGSGKTRWKLQSPSTGPKAPGMHKPARPVLACTANLAKRCAAGMTLIPACSSLLCAFAFQQQLSSDLGVGKPPTAPLQEAAPSHNWWVVLTHRQRLPTGVHWG